ncbi:MAG: hydantoinase/oxoprolinase family protein [Luteitalea sp.]|nr:hydantoinase/oxoprolinase family protein [Luteitalea sp.]
MSVRIGVDTGGTFTDLVVLDERGLTIHKVRSTPEDPSTAIVQGLSEAAGEIANGEIVHGSTVATNAVLEERGARVALITTAGFEDVLRIGRQTRRALYDFMVTARRTLVPPELTFGLSERVAADGEVLEPIQPDQLDAVIARLRAQNPEAVAVCLLHSYVNASHEEAVAARLSTWQVPVSCSHHVLPEYREFERWSTTVINAYVTPLMARYLASLEAHIGTARLRIMQSNGGSIAAATARSTAVRTILSGPAAGVVGARAVAETAGVSRIISFDMGGTSTDVSLIDQTVAVTTESMIADCPLRLPIIDIHTVGAGGGSIACIDAGGALRVGPRSAGADPGPACYGQGTELTVTDANLLLGRLDPTYFLGGRMVLDVERPRRLAEDLAKRAALTVRALAQGIIRVANANMERAIRVVSVRRGFDPRDFALLAFGGAGGMHACEIAAALEMRTVIVPRYAGVLSALGMLLADVKKDYSRSVLRPADTLCEGELRELFQPLMAQAEKEMAEEGFADASLVVECAVDVRYIGQSYEITVPLVSEYRDEFDRRHARLYGYSNPRRPIEVVNARVLAVGLARKPELPWTSYEVKRRATACRMRDSVFDGRSYQTAIYRHEDLVPGSGGDGPALVASEMATTVIPPGFQFQVDEAGNVIASGRTRRPRRVRKPEDLAAVQVSSAARFSDGRARL